jgi:hypothetical protein
MLSVLSGIAEFERDLILQRTVEGRARAMAEGKGRPQAEIEQASGARSERWRPDKSTRPSHAGEADLTKLLAPQRRAEKSPAHAGLVSV